jgi:hypothetical protein
MQILKYCSKEMYLSASGVAGAKYNDTNFDSHTLDVAKIYDVAVTDSLEMLDMKLRPVGIIIFLHLVYIVHSSYTLIVYSIVTKALHGLADLSELNARCCSSTVTGSSFYLPASISDSSFVP